MKKSKLQFFDQFTDKLLLWCDYVLLTFTGVALIALTMVIFIDVAARFLFNHPIPGGKEVSELIMPYIAFCALSYTLYTRKHIRITLVSHFVTGKTLKAAEFFYCLMGAIFCGLIAWGSWKFFWTSFALREEMLAVVKLPWYVGKFAMALGYLFFALRYLLRLKSQLIPAPKSEL